MSQAISIRSNPLQNFFKLDPSTKLVYLVLSGLSLGLLLGLLLSLFNSTKVYRLKLAAGDSRGESYVLSKAIEAVVEAEYPKIQIEVIETGGTSANLQQLEAETAQLATAQADVTAPAPAPARTVAVLYQDLFQIVVKQNAGINQFTDLKGKTIGLQQTGGQFRSFLEVADHYGLQQTDFNFVGNSDQAADEAFQLNQAAALFRVRAAGNRSVAGLVRQYQGKLIGIEQAAAMKIKYPAFQPSAIPQGAYQGNPPVPANNLNTIAVERLLLAHHKVPDSVIRDITATINERRQQIADQIKPEAAEVKPLVANISDPRQSSGNAVPIHPGALGYYDRNRPSFVQENADFLALLLTVALLGGSWLWELKNWIGRRKKDYADRYIKNTLDLMKAGKDADLKQQELDQVFRQAAADLVDEKISQESFRTFNEAYRAHLRSFIMGGKAPTTLQPSRYGIF